MIGIGINQNVVLQRATINEKGSLELAFIEVKAMVEKKSIFEEANSAKVSTDTKATTLLLFPLKKPDGVRNEGKTEDELLEMISDDMKQMRNRLSQLLLLFLKEEEVVWDAYKSTGVDKDNYRTLLLKKDTLETISNNYFTQFINMVTPKLDKPENAMRIKLLRQSKDKAFATIPGRYLDEQPWCELMDVPEKNSRLQFSKWEKEQGLDSSAPPAKSDTDAKDSIVDTPEAKKSAFGQR